ncbi:NAD(+) kinase [Gammaproteobacteria bacterium]|jgi:NAD+ kinase|nr:NAD(+) kinase [Gammaproteobacteria bacterium]
MHSEFRRVAILGRYDDPHVAEPMTALVMHLAEAGIEVFAADEMSLDLAVTRVAENKLAANADLMIAIGGDGTMLYAGNLAGEREIPLLGINRGRLGFLADVSPDEMIASVDYILAGDYSCESRLMLSATLQTTDGQTVTATALNDVVLQRRETGRMVDVVTSIAGRYVNTHSGDGLIVATPTGSTAYALSCGGPIIEPLLDAVVVVPICPHTLTDRPVVVPASCTVEIRVLEREDTRAEVTVDGHALGDIRPGDSLTISSAENRVRLIHPPGYDFYSILRSKLFWGRNSRIRDDRTD